MPVPGEWTVQGWQRTFPGPEKILVAVKVGMLGSTWGKPSDNLQNRQRGQATRPSMETRAQRLQLYAGPSTGIR